MKIQFNGISEITKVPIFTKDLALNLLVHR